MKKIIPLLILFFVIHTGITLAQAEKTNEYQTPESVVRAIFDLCTVEPGKPKDWNKFREIFIDKGIMIVRAASVGFTPIGADEFIKLWEGDVKKYKLDEIGYDDKITEIKTTEFGNIAVSLVRFESKLLTPGSRIKKGLNIFSTVKKDGRWWLASVTEEVENATRKIPDEIFK